MLLPRDDGPHDQVLLVGLLNRVEADLAIEHPEVGPVVLRKRVVPVFEVGSCAPRPIITRVAGFLLLEGIVELVLGPEASVEFALEVVHELPVATALVVVVVKSLVVYVALLPIVTAVHA